MWVPPRNDSARFSSTKASPVAARSTEALQSTRAQMALSTSLSSLATATTPEARERLARSVLAKFGGVSFEEARLELAAGGAGDGARVQAS